MYGKSRNSSFITDLLHRGLLQFNILCLNVMFLLLFLYSEQSERICEYFFVGQEHECCRENSLCKFCFQSLVESLHSTLPENDF